MTHENTPTTSQDGSCATEAAQAPNGAPPRRAHHLTVDIGGDDQRALVALLRHFIYLVETGSRNVVSGGPDSGGSMTYTVDETMTHERYFAESEKWLEARRDSE